MTDSRIISQCESTGDAGDKYTGLDRFGRIVAQRWRTGTAGLDHLTYSYDANSSHTGGVNALFGDGSVRFVRQSITVAALAALISRNGGEVLNLD